MSGQAWDIYQEVLTLIQGINGIAPYLRAVAEVFPSRQIIQDVPQTKKPAVAVIVAMESPEERVGMMTVDYRLIFTFQIFASADEDLESLHQVLDLIEDIKHAMYDNMFKTVHDYDTSMVNTGAPVVYPVGDKQASGIITFAITYRDNYHP